MTLDPSTVGVLFLNFSDNLNHDVVFGWVTLDSKQESKVVWQARHQINSQGSERSHI
jgi:hypothetical protein